MTTVRRLIAALALAGLLATLSAAPAAAVMEPPPPSQYVTTKGKAFIAPDGQPLLLRGINLGNWLMPEGYMFKFKAALSPRRIHGAIDAILGPVKAGDFWTAFRDRYITRDDIQFIKAAGFNTVRVPLHYALFVTGTDPPVFAGPGYALIDRLIAWCREAGLYVLLDLHAAPGGQTGINHDDGPGYPLLFYVPAHQDLTVALWRTLAARYRDEPTVLGYDLLNEPIASYHDVAYLNSKLEPLYRRIASAIREVDPHHILVFEGAQWGTRFDVFSAPPIDNVAYSYHKFWSATTREAIQEYLNFSNLYDVPILLGESGELTDAWVQAFRLLHERHGVSWIFWTYKNLDSLSTVASITRPPHWDAVVAAADRRAGAVSGALAGADLAAALESYLENIKLKNCRINVGYLDALGLAGPSSAAATPAARR